MLSLMKELSAHNIPKSSDYGITEDEYGDIIDMCQNEGYIKSAHVNRGGRGNKVCGIFLENATLTVKGFEYIHENSTLMKWCKRLLHLADWLH